MAESEEQQQARAIVDCIAPLQAAIQDVETICSQIPEAQDFHFFSNFERFRTPIGSIRGRAAALLGEVGMCTKLRAEVSQWPEDVEASYDWLVGVQDDVLEGVGAALDELGLGAGKGPRDFLLDKPKRAFQDKGAPQKNVKVASKRKQRPPVPFHVKSLQRPQDKFDYPVDNSNTPFKHLSREALLGTAVDAGASAVERYAKSLGLMEQKHGHPLKEELDNMTFLKDFPADGELMKPKPLSETPFTFVDLPSQLEKMAAKLREAREIAVDLENHHYRSFQGFVCLMQVSTRSEDFIVDTLALRDHVGPALRQIFADGSIRKIIHGSDRDILWLQRDFGIYICNLFDTGQAARVLHMEGFGLGYLLQTFCDVNADKRYQLADWRLRPLTAEMLRYAREDTHYLLYIYDKLKEMLRDGQTSEQLYVEVCQRSRDLCLQLYEKELYTDKSFLQLYGLAEKNYQPKELAILAALHSWRDTLSRKEDESTGYVMPNHLLFRLAEEAPEDPKRLNAILKSAHSLAASHAATILGVIREALSRLDEGTSVTAQPSDKNLDTCGGNQKATVPEENPKASLDTEDSTHRKKSAASVVLQRAPSSVFYQRPSSSLLCQAVSSSAEAIDEPIAVKENDRRGKAQVMHVKRSSIAGALFGRATLSGKTQINSEDAEAVARAESIRVSVALPFQAAVAPVEDPEKNANAPFIEENDWSTVSLNTAEISHALDEDKGTTDEDGGKATEEHNSGNIDEDNVEHNNTAQDKGKVEPANYLPLSLNELYGKQQTKRPGKDTGHREKKQKKSRTDSQEKKQNQAQVQSQAPFDYSAAAAAAKKLEQTRPAKQPEKTKSKNRNKDKGKQTHFDPYRDAQLDLGGLPAAGKRRYVFPSSGNKTATFK